MLQQCTNDVPASQQPGPGSVYPKQLHRESIRTGTIYSTGAANGSHKHTSFINTSTKHAFLHESTITARQYNSIT